MAAFSSATETPSFPYRTSTKLMPSFSQSSNHNISPSFSVFKPPQIYAIWRYQVEAVSLVIVKPESHPMLGIILNSRHFITLYLFFGISGSNGRSGVQGLAEGL
ncbi:hypothetical protein L2E82_30747 [Cichorium intybus]|uniref:Uncharacterized protein n=1 Tax=Cichorium intybus TaxID=13427 RepID=A0ACB9D157_CICIN|nr:hypothetical protein L2E82_30747 [Cichorium intybus]